MFIKKMSKKFGRYLSIAYLCTRIKEKNTFTKFTKGESVAQLVEHITFNDGVLGSNPSGFTVEHLIFV